MMATKRAEPFLTTHLDAVFGKPCKVLSTTDMYAWVQYHADGRPKSRLKTDLIEIPKYPFQVIFHWIDDEGRKIQRTYSVRANSAAEARSEAEDQHETLQVAGKYTDLMLDDCTLIVVQVVL
jgi:acyl transferase domain-containing protein